MRKEIQLTNPEQIPPLKKGIWLVILHAQRIPPHVGLCFDNNYCSLNIKGKEINIPAEIMLKSISLQKKESLFFELKAHPVFSNSYLHENFLLHLNTFEKVGDKNSTCFTPIRCFFEENYQLRNEKLTLLTDLFPELLENEFVRKIYSLNLKGDLKENSFQFQTYSQQELIERLSNL